MILIILSKKISLSLKQLLKNKYKWSLCNVLIYSNMKINITKINLNVIFLQTNIYDSVTIY